jgi:holo-[acyl-carrier protein] synthase
MILGLGIDVCSIERMQGVIDRWGERFAHRILGPEERALYARRQDKAALLAGRFATKEAAAKAMAGGVGVGWHHLEVRAAPKQPPELILHGPARALADSVGVEGVQMSISHDAGVAAAVVILEGPERKAAWR